MESHKKIAFSTVGPANVEKKKVKRTIRLTITLPESNEKCCPEYHYGELLTQSKVSYMTFHIFPVCEYQYCSNAIIVELLRSPSIPVPTPMLLVIFDPDVT